MLTRPTGWRLGWPSIKARLTSSKKFLIPDNASLSPWPMGLARRRAAAHKMRLLLPQWSSVPHKVISRVAEMVVLDARHSPLMPCNDLEQPGCSVDQTDRADRIDIVAAEFRRALPQRDRAHKPEESLRSRQEIVALPQNQIEVLPRERQKVQPRCQRYGARGDTTVGTIRAHRLRDIHSGRADGVHQDEIICRNI